LQSSRLKPAAMAAGLLRPAALHARSAVPLCHSRAAYEPSGERSPNWDPGSRNAALLALIAKEC